MDIYLNREEKMLLRELRGMGRSYHPDPRFSEGEDWIMEAENGA